MVNFDTVDENGNIWFVRGEGVIIVFHERDDSGNIIDPATHDRYLKIPAIGYDELIPVDGDDTAAYRIELDLTDLHSINTMGTPFMVIDNQGLVPLMVWGGIIRERSLVI